MLRNEDRVPAPRRLLSVVSGSCGREALGHELRCVSQHRGKSFDLEIRVLLRAQVKTLAKRCAPQRGEYRV